MDAHNLLFQKLTKLAFHDLSMSEIEGFETVSGDQTCSICKRMISEQPSEFGAMAYLGTNSYKEEITYCVCCAAFFQNNTTVLGVEKPKAPNTSQKFGMLAGAGAFIELNSNRVLFFLPPKSAEKIPEQAQAIFKQAGVEILVMTQYDQIKYLSKIEITYPAVWVNNFGRKTTELAKNLKFSLSKSNLFMVTDDELNSSIESLYKINLENLVEFAKLYTSNPNKTKFKKMITELSNGIITPKDVGEIIQSYPEFIPMLEKLNKDPHMRIQSLVLAEKVGN